MDSLRLVFMVSCFLACYAQFADEMQDYERECIGEDKFRCNDNSCVLQSQYCDGIKDCLDGTDENFCSNMGVDPKLCNETHQYLCMDRKKCIPMEWVCNHEFDCDDDSDEEMCYGDEVTRNVTRGTSNDTCNGFLCGDGECISSFWRCDGVYDCADRSDEVLEVCRHRRKIGIYDGRSCLEYKITKDSARNYECLDRSFCLPMKSMCNGLKDCRDGSDEGPFCAEWQNMCTDTTCPADEDEVVCYPDRDGPVCFCAKTYIGLKYNQTTRKCDDVDECAQAAPICSHHCTNRNASAHCSCDDGYILDVFNYLCFVNDTEAFLFFSTSKDVRYLKVTSKEMVIIAEGLKEPHGVTYDGKFVYWVETTQGHQAIVRAQLANVKETKEVIVSIGLEDPGDIAIDYLGGHIYFTDAERGIISACRTDGSLCTTIRTKSRRPRFVTLDVRHGKMYWADWDHRAVIMGARMDGSHPEVMVDHLETFATGLAIDVPNGRLYFVDKTIKVVKVDDKQVYFLFDEVLHHPYAISIFENSVYWSDWTSNTIMSTDKMHGKSHNMELVYSAGVPVFDLHVYHEALLNKTVNPCAQHNCSHFCFVTSNTTSTCACPDGMQIVGGNFCVRIAAYRPQYIIVGGGIYFTKFQYNVMGNLESHATPFDIGRVQAMAYDSNRDLLYIYDGQRRTINLIAMKDFTLGVTEIMINDGLVNVVDMDYDYVADALYFLDSGRRLIEVVSIRAEQRTHVYRFADHEIPLSICIAHDYGTMLVAVMETEGSFEIHIDSIGLDGKERKHLISNGILGPHVRMRYTQNRMDHVYFSDESRGTIEIVHPEGTGRERYRKTKTSIIDLAVTSSLVFWTDRRKERIFWADIHETSKIRRMDFSIFTNNTQLHLQATFPSPDFDSPLLQHPCFQNTSHCSDICVQAPHPKPLHEGGKLDLRYSCLCPLGLLVKQGKCVKMVQCEKNELYCHRSNSCFEKKRLCDGRNDCSEGEDEEGCDVSSDNVTRICQAHEKYCYGKCIDMNSICHKTEPLGPTLCDVTQFQCKKPPLCIDRMQVCDGRENCPDGSDEAIDQCDIRECLPTEFMCDTGNCILYSWKCDGDEDCDDASDETNCGVKTCDEDRFQCRNGECIDVKKRCDGQQDCIDFSDEDECEESPVIDEAELESSKCAEWEYACELNASICLPLTARCNASVECPGATDEVGCEFRCARNGLFACKRELTCIFMTKVCDGKRDCTDGSDETKEACDMECRNGYLCANGQCIEWREVCDGIKNCFDSSDENGLCSSACSNHTCANRCQATPLGPHCICPEGFYPGVGTCDDINECFLRACAQLCINVPGSYVCGCHSGYRLRSDRRTCKARNGHMSVLYVSGNSVKSISPSGKPQTVYNDDKVASITDMDYNVRLEMLYVTSSQANTLVEVNKTNDDVVIVTNVGKPTRVSVDWITGNVYFADDTPGAKCIRVCNLVERRCARLLRLPSDVEVTSLIADPGTRHLYYCMTYNEESWLWTSGLDGRRPSRLAGAANCSGLAIDSFSRELYMATIAPPHILRMDLQGDRSMKILTNDPQLDAPRGLVLFEDYIFYLVANSFKLSRCRLYGTKYCEPFLYRIFDANTFVINHPSVQRDDLNNDCKGYVCSNVCVLGRRGPVCLCDNGNITKTGSCTFQENELPLFNGWPQLHLRAHGLWYTLLALVLTGAVIYGSMSLYYHYVYKPRRDRSVEAPVRFHNVTEGPSTSTDRPPVQVEVVERDNYRTAHEFFNPIGYMQNFWQRSFRRTRRPIGTAGLSVVVPTSPDTQTSSETDSTDVEEKTTKKMLEHTEPLNPESNTP